VNVDVEPRPVERLALREPDQRRVDVAVLATATSRRSSTNSSGIGYTSSSPSCDRKPSRSSTRGTVERLALREPDQRRVDVAVLATEGRVEEVVGQVHIHSDEIEVGPEEGAKVSSKL
jgi:hypothetical protein